MNMLADLQAATGGEGDFKKKHKLKDGDNDQLREQYKSSRDALSEFSPFKWRQ